MVRDVGFTAKKEEKWRTVLYNGYAQKCKHYTGMIVSSLLHGMGGIVAAFFIFCYRNMLYTVLYFPLATDRGQRGTV